MSNPLKPAQPINCYDMVTVSECVNVQSLQKFKASTDIASSTIPKSSSSNS